MYVFILFYFFFYIIYFYIFTFSCFFTGFVACNSAFEQGHLEPWRYINAFIIILLLLKHIVCDSND